MAGRIDKALKQQLVAAGRWAAFQDRRDELKVQGYDPDDARLIALGEINTEHVDVSDNLAPATTGDALPVAPAALAGKAASEPEIARWVARNIDNADASPDDCPDPFAWTLLRLCRDNPGYVHVFIKDIWTKLMVSETRRQDTARPDGEIDGTPTIELIARIQAMSDAAKAGSKCKHCGQDPT